MPTTRSRCTGTPPGAFGPAARSTAGCDGANARLLPPDRLYRDPQRSVLRLRDDVYGATVNVCAKIGEDIAKGGETLVTDTVVARTSGSGCAATSRATIGGPRVLLYRVLP